MSPTLPALNALTELVDAARATRDRADRRRRRDIAHRLEVIAIQLDGARTRLVQDGREYLPRANAMIQAGRTAIRNYQHALVR